MSHIDSTKRFGLIGLALIVVAYLAWAFVLPRFTDDTADKANDQQLQDITTTPVNKQDAPPRPASEPPKPMPPSQ